MYQSSKSPRGESKIRLTILTCESSLANILARTSSGAYESIWLFDPSTGCWSTPFRWPIRVSHSSFAPLRIWEITGAHSCIFLENQHLWGDCNRTRQTYRWWRRTSKQVNRMHKIRQTSTPCCPLWDGGTSRCLIARLYCSSAKAAFESDRGMIAVWCSNSSWIEPTATIAWRTAGSWYAAWRTSLSQKSDPKKPASCGQVRCTKNANDRFDSGDAFMSTVGVLVSDERWNWTSSLL